MTRGRKIAIAAVLLLVPGVACGSCCVISAIGANANSAAIDRAREQCRSPMVFRLRAGGRSSVPGDWECVPAEEPLRVEQETAEDAAVPTAAAPSAVPPATVIAPATPPSFWQQPMTEWPDHGTCVDRTVWALFDDLHIGRDEFERRDHDQERPALAAAARERLYVLHTRAVLGEYDFARHRFPITIDPQTFGCSISGLEGDRVELALEGASAHHYADFSEWVPRAWSTTLDMPEGEARGFHGPIQADFAFRVAHARYDRHIVRNAVLGEMEDIGAGALIEPRIVAYRLTAHGQVVLDTAPAGDGPPP